MNFKLKSLFYAFLVFITLCVSCETDEIEPDQDLNGQNTELSSNLRTALQNIATFDGSFDNVLDGASCLSIVLPVTIEVNGIEVLIETEEDYDTIEAIVEEFEEDVDTIEFQFPITIILADFSEIVINSEEELEQFTAVCDEENEIDDDIECIDIQFPISFTVFDPDSNQSDVVTINSDEELFLFLSNLDGNVVSLNFPITLITADGETLEVNNQDELEEAIETAIDTCDEDDDNDNDDDDDDDDDNDDDDDDDDDDEIDLEWVIENLSACYWVVSVDGSPNFEVYHFEFLENGELIAVNVDTDEVLTGGFWEVIINDDEDLILIIGGFPLASLNGTWIVTEYDDEFIEFINENGVNTLEMEQDCDDNNNDGNDDDDDDDSNDDNDNNGGVDIEELYENLIECGWGLIINDIPDNLTAYEFVFNEDGTLSATNINNEDDVIEGGFWELDIDDEGNLILIIESFPVFDNVNGTWIIIEFEDGHIELIREDGNNVDTLEIEQDC